MTRIIFWTMIAGATAYDISCGVYHWPTISETLRDIDKELGGKGVHQPGLVPATRYCLPGDVVECEVEGIGILRNPVAEAMADSGRVAAE